MIDLKILNLSPNENPRYESAGAAAFDLSVAKDVTIPPGGCALVSTGLHMIIPEGYEGQIRLRSSMYKKGIVMPNAPGTIDSDYRGEILIAIRNVLQHEHEEVHFKVGDRIAQMLIKEVPKVSLAFLNPDQFAAYATTARGSGGFGSTGTGTLAERL